MTPPSDRPIRRRALLDSLAALALLALPLLLYRQALGLWWMEDDFFQLRYALDHGPLAYGLDPEVWRRLPNRVLSPLLFVSYDLDLALFGLEPAAFYAHQLVSIGLAGAALFLVLRFWLPRAWALLGGGVFLLGPPVASLAPLLMVRHYPEAIGLGAAAAGAWVLAVRRGRWEWSGLSTLLYLAASAAKEIAVPLPFFLALLPEGGRRRRLRYLVPHAVALAVYAGYRLRMLGTPLGGYGFATTPADWPRLALTLPWKVGRELAAGGGWGWAALAVLLVPVLVLVFRSRRAALLLAAGFALALGPVLPVSVAIEPRFALGAWLVVAAALPFGLRALVRRSRKDEREERSAGRSPATALPAVLAFAAALLLYAAAWTGVRGGAGYLDRAERMSAEYRGFLDLGPDALLRHPLGPPASMEELRRFARDVLDHPPFGDRFGDWFYDDLYLCGPDGEPDPPPGPIHGFDPRTGRLADVTREIPALARSYCTAIRWDAPLEAELRPEPGGVLAWELGPYEEGRYAFVLDHGRLRYDLPREGAFHLRGLRAITLRVRYEDPEGWVTYSPEIEVDLANAEPHGWRR